MTWGREGIRKELGLQEVSEDPSENNKKKKDSVTGERRKYYGNSPVMTGQKKGQDSKQQTWK